MSTGTITAPTTSPSLTSPTGPRPLQLLDSNIPSVLNSPVSASALTSPRSSALGLSTPPPSARTFKQANSRRQSSISYFPSDYVRPPGVRSPTTPSSPFGGPSPRRTASVGVWEDDVASALAKVKRDRRSLGSLPVERRESLASVAGSGVDHGPLTLTEKHADLLQFIAQKEAKCLELRSQLEVHEAELSQLKRKWEKIVSRGMDRAYSTPSAATSSTVSSILPTARDALKEGARLLAAGLNDFSTPDQLPQSTPSSVVSPVIPPMSGFATVSRASIASQKINSRHEATQSMSSVSTAASSTRTSTTQSSQRLSQSSASSVLSSLSLEDPIEEGTPAEVLLDEPSMGLPIQTNRSEKTLRRRSQEKKDALTRSPLSQSPLANDLQSLGMPSSAGKSKTKTRPASMVLGNATHQSSVSTWMGNVGSSVGKKWEEMQKNDTFTKSQKRASLLLSDVSQSLFAALASPTPSSGPSPMQKPSPLSVAPSSSASHSLLDDEPEQLEGQPTMLSAPLIPSVVNPNASPSPAPVLPQKKVDGEDEDEWNW